MQTMTLYSGPLSMFGMKAHIAILEKGLTVDVVMVPFTQGHRYEPKHPEVLRVNPKGQVPVLIHGEDEVFDSTQIFEYLEDICPNPPLWGKDPAKRALARKLELQSDEIFFAHVIRLMGLQDRLEIPEAKSAIASALAWYGRMDKQLADRPFLAGDFSYADIGFFMAQIYAERMGAPMSRDTALLWDWRVRMASRPSVRKAVAPLVTFLQGQGRPVPAHLV